ncbi:MAG: hypothetical protein A2020_12330 [Lentisphaerae bacterium GWF2_45_14]|nr:MAG: hypothetical protein A2020_12330 [Lentisphaerae bacterium GWF2_45_14]
MTEATTQNEVVRLTDEGNFGAVITDAYPVEFGAKAGEEPKLKIKFELLTADNKIADIYLDMSTEYVGDTGKRSIDMSLDTLKSLGIGSEIAKIGTLKGKHVQIYGKKAGKKDIVYYRFSFEKKVNLNDAQQRLAALLGGTSMPQSQPPLQSAATNLFQNNDADDVHGEDIPF